MYFGTTARGIWSGGHASTGVTEPSQRWFYAEGATGSFFDTFILLANPQRSMRTSRWSTCCPSGDGHPCVEDRAGAGPRSRCNIEDEADARLQKRVGVDAHRVERADRHRAIDVLDHQARRVPVERRAQQLRRRRRRRCAGRWREGRVGGPNELPHLHPAVESVGAPAGGDGDLSARERRRRS